MKRLFVLVGLATIFAAAGVARADIAPPNMKDYKLDPPTALGQTAGSAPFTIEKRDDIDVVRLQIPRSVLQTMQTNAGPAATTSGMTSEATRTMFAGVFLSFALAFGGVWVLRSRKGPGVRVAAMLMITFAVGGLATTAVWANAGPPGRVIYPPGTLPKALKNDASLNGTVVYEVVDGGNEIRLLIPANEVKRSK